MGEGTLQVVLLVLLIFAARIVDVSLATMRIVFISRGHKYLAPVVGFFEVLIWLLAFRQILTNVTNVGYYFAFAGGFAAGTFVGLSLEEKMAMGSRVIRIITGSDATRLIASLREAGHGVTSMVASGAEGPVHVIFSIVKRPDLDRVIGLVNHFNPRAFYTIEDVRFVREGVFPARESFIGRKLWMLRAFRKSR